MSNWLDKVVDGLKIIAPTMANLALPGSGVLVEGLMRAVTGDKDSEAEEVARQIMADPKLMADLQIRAMDMEVKMAEVEASKMAAVNATMQAESRSEHWPQYSWRPWNGFWFAPTICAIYFLLPILGKTVPDIPQGVWVGWLAVLGVATYQRGKEKRVKAGDQSCGLLAGAINAIRGKE